MKDRQIYDLGNGRLFIPSGASDAGIGLKVNGTLYSADTGKQVTETSYWPTQLREKPLVEPEKAIAEVTSGSDLGRILLEGTSQLVELEPMKRQPEEARAGPPSYFND